MIRDNAIVNVLRRAYGFALRHAANPRPFDPGDWIVRMKRESIAVGFVPERIVMANFSLGPGGAERQILETVAGLAEAGLRDVHFLGVDLSSHANADFFADPIREYGVRIVDMHVQPPARLPHKIEKRIASLPPRIGGLVARLAGVLSQTRPQCAFGWQDEAGVALALAAIAVGTPRIAISLRSMSPPHYLRFGRDDLYLAPIYRALIARGDVTLIANSVAVARDYENWLHLPIGTIDHNPNSFEWCFDASAGDPEISTEPIVGGVLRLSAEKNPGLFVDVAAVVCRSHPRVIFEIFGTGPLRGEIEARIAAAGFGDRVRLRGLMPHGEFQFARFAALLQTSEIEGMPNVVGEAQAAGVPVVATDVGGTRELIVDGETGFVHADPDPGRLASSILRILEDADWRAAARRRARDNIRRNFSRRAMIERTVKFMNI